MKQELISAVELEKLPLRAIVALVARHSRRITSQLKGIVPEDTLSNALNLMENALTNESIASRDKVSIVAAAESIVRAYVHALPELQTVERANVLFCVVQGALTGMHALLAVEDHTNARNHIKRAAKAAQRSLASTSVGNECVAILEKARSDYDRLVRECGQHNGIILGEPIDWLEPD